jgi:hypothetical protein
VSSDAEKAKAKVQQLADAERRLGAKLSARLGELGVIDQALGKAALEAEIANVDVDPVPIQRATYLRTEIDSIQAAIIEARRSRLAAIPLVWQVEADDLESEAERIEGDAADRQKKTDKMLAELEAWEGVAYQPSPPNSNPLGLVGNQQGGAPNMVVVHLPRTEYMRHEARGLREQAANTRARTPRQDGKAEGLGLEQLTDHIFANPMIIGPAIDSVGAWVAGERSRLEAKSQRLTMPNQEGWAERNNPIRYRISWKNGELQLDGCRSERISEGESATSKAFG